MEEKAENKLNYTKLNIFQKMSIATSKIQNVAKNLKIGEGTKSEYKAVSEKDVLAVVKPIESEVGIYSYPYSRNVIKEERVTFQNKFGETENFIIRIKTVYRFINIDKTDEFIDITTYGDGVDNQDKAPGKAMTYPDKYALLKAYKISTGDDPDNNKSKEMKLTQKDTQDLQSMYIPKLDALVAETETDYEDILKYFKVKSNIEMTIPQLRQAVAILEKKKNKSKEEVF